MAAKFFLVLCASALFVQNAVSQCGCGRYSAPAIGLGYGGCGAGLGYAGLGNIVTSRVATSNGGGLPIASRSSIAPSSVAVSSNNDIDGELDVDGELPFLAAVGFDGEVPSSGSAGTSYSCGDSTVGMTSQSLAAAGVGAADAAGYGSSAGVCGRRLGGCGCGLY